MLRILYINAITTEATGTILKRGVIDGFGLSKVAQTHGYQLDSYDIFYGDQRLVRRFADFFENGNYDAVVLSGSEKNTSESHDPWVKDYLKSLQALLGFDPENPESWSGPPVPVLGICFGHQALACALGGETARVGLRVGGEDIQSLAQAHRHPVFQPLLAEQSLGARLKMIVYHGDQVVRMPRHFHRLFVSDYCEVQGMAHDVYPIVSLQPHPEMNETIRRDSTDQETWSKIPLKQFENNVGPQVLARFLDWVASRR